MVKTKKFKFFLAFLCLLFTYQYVQFLKIKRIEDYSDILFKAASQKDKVFSILLGNYISKNKSNYSWTKFGIMEEYFLYLELHPNNPDYKKIKTLIRLKLDTNYPDFIQ
ncbi:MAG: hypothetical protein COB02_14090 [Candidatus Cloacimonadota bacterium]|nr:MAG: hypothetical protein COB02_14090 [Candidatus Cloacimonadota bacterium]